MDNDILEFNTEDIRNSFNQPVNLADLENYVSAQVSNSNRPARQTANTENTQRNNLFTISQEDYIAYRIYLRDRLYAKRKRDNFRHNLKSNTIWFIKAILMICLLFGLCWGFYLLTWFIQNSIHFNKMSIPTV